MRINQWRRTFDLRCKFDSRCDIYYESGLCNVLSGKSAYKDAVIAIIRYFTLLFERKEKKVAAVTFRPFDPLRRDSAPNFARFLSPKKSNNHGGHVIRIITGKREYFINWRLRSYERRNRRDKSRCRVYTMAALMIGRVAGSIRVMHYTLVVYSPAWWRERKLN